MKKNNRFYHIGIVVESIEHSMDYYAKNMNIHFAEPVVTDLTISHPLNGRIEVVSAKVTYSRGASPYIELIEAIGESVFSKRNIGEILYYGLWESNIPKRIKQLNKNDVVIDYLISQGESPPNAIITAPDMNGVRSEYVTDSVQGYVRVWTLTGKAPVKSGLSFLLVGVFSVYYFIKNKIMGNIFKLK
ncbi:MAG: VOC family protein [Cellvibrionaceae bacterium]